MIYHNHHAPTFGRRTFAALFLSTLVAVAAAPLCRADEAKPAGKTVRLLTVGNSFSGNATKYLADLAKADGNTLVHRSCSVGGASMELHWGKVAAHEKDPADPAGLYASKKGLKEELASGEWDFVTIQQASIKSHDVETYRPFAKQLHDFIKANAPKAEVVIHQTWEYRVDDPRFAPKKTRAKGEPATQQEMHEMLTASYKTIAAELGIRRLPVGDAFHAADTDAMWGFKLDATFDPKTAKYPSLPDQSRSLHTGWQWSKAKSAAVETPAAGGAESPAAAGPPDAAGTGKPVAAGEAKPVASAEYKLGMDGHHANTAGQFLGACVWYEMMFGRDVRNNAFVPKGVDAEYAKFLRQTAHAAVEAAAVAAVPAAK